MPGSYLIRWLTFSKWSHVAAVNDDGYAIEATWPRVRKVKVEDIISKHSAYEFREIECAPDAWIWLERQVGKKYDTFALFAYLNPWRDWAEDDKWFCSELVAYVSSFFFQAFRVSPQMLYLASKPC